MNDCDDAITLSLHSEFLFRPMKEQRERYGPALYTLTKQVLLFGCTFMSLWLDMARGKCELVLLIRDNYCGQWTLNQFYLQDHSNS
jgi:hypothetical protein